MKRKRDKLLGVSFHIAPPQMARYMAISRKIYGIYLRFIAPEDMVVYSINEVFFDLTSYLTHYHCGAHELVRRMIQTVLDETGITATAGIGTNRYLAKIAMDITAKHMPPDKNGVRIAALDEMSYRKTLWDRRELSDFWRVGRGTIAHLASLSLYTMGDIARFSCLPAGEDVLFDTFGIHAEFLIDHAWGVEPCTIAAIKAYHPKEKSLSSGQVLKEPTKPQTAFLIVREMADALSLSLLKKGLAANQITLDIHYAAVSRSYAGAIAKDRYGRDVPRPSHGSENFTTYSALSTDFRAAVARLFPRIVEKKLLIKKLTLTAAHVLPLSLVPECEKIFQFSLDKNSE